MTRVETGHGNAARSSFFSFFSSVYHLLQSSFYEVLLSFFYHYPSKHSFLSFLYSLFINTSSPIYIFILFCNHTFFSNVVIALFIHYYFYYPYSFILPLAISIKSRIFLITGENWLLKMVIFKISITLSRC